MAGLELTTQSRMTSNIQQSSFLPKCSDYSYLPHLAKVLSFKCLLKLLFNVYYTDDLEIRNSTDVIAGAIISSPEKQRQRDYESEASLG